MHSDSSVEPPIEQGLRRREACRLPTGTFLEYDHAKYSSTACTADAMNRPLRIGYLGARTALATVMQTLQDQHVDLTLEPVDLLSDNGPDVELLIVDAESLTETPQFVSQRVRNWNNLPIVVRVSALDLNQMRLWARLGALECLRDNDIERWQLVIEQVRQGRESMLSAHLLQSIIDAVPTPLFFKDENAVYLGCNTAFERALGITRQELVGMTVYDLAPPDLATEYQRTDRELLQCTGTRVYESEMLFADGKRHNVVLQKATYQRADGSIGGLVGAMLDITERKALEDKLQRLATLDPLTSANNRRQFFKLSEIERARCKREKRPLALMLLDIDHFKRVNDTYGHAAGDEVLVHLTRVASELLRQHDILGRAGGEEFYVTLGNTNLDEAQTVAERLRREIEQSQVVHDGQQIRITISIGVVEWRYDEPLETALQRADLAMYQAKDSGRNRIVSQTATSPNATPA